MIRFQYQSQSKRMTTEQALSMKEDEGDMYERNSSWKTRRASLKKWITSQKKEGKKENKLETVEVKTPREGQPTENSKKTKLLLGREVFDSRTKRMSPEQALLFKKSQLPASKKSNDWRETRKELKTLIEKDKTKNDLKESSKFTFCTLLKEKPKSAHASPQKSPNNKRKKFLSIAQRVPQDQIFKMKAHVMEEQKSKKEWKKKSKDLREFVKEQKKKNATEEKDVFEPCLPPARKIVFC